MSDEKPYLIQRHKSGVIFAGQGENDITLPLDKYNELLEDWENKEKIIESLKAQTEKEIYRLTEEYSKDCKSCKERQGNMQIGICDWHYSIGNFAKYLCMNIFEVKK